MDEDAGGKIRPDRRQEAGDRVEPAAVLAQPAAGEQRKRPTVYGWRGSCRISSVGPSSTELARVEHADALAGLPDHAEVVADEEDGGAEPLLQLSDEVEHLGLDRGVEPGRRLVEDQQARVRRERHRDDHALLHPAESWCG